MDWSTLLMSEAVGGVSEPLSQYATMKEGGSHLKLGFDDTPPSPHPHMQKHWGRLDLDESILRSQLATL